jgi:hypothetical protein
MFINSSAMNWNGAEYAAGFRAKIKDVPSSRNESCWWQCGWEDANLDLFASDRHEQMLAGGNQDDYEESWGLLFDAGGDARVNGIAFDERGTQPWKEGWIEADINFGIAMNRV